MTPEQAAEQYAQEHGDACESIWDGERLAENAFLAGHAHAQNRWVKIGIETVEDMPVNKDILLYRNGRMLDVGMYDGEGLVYISRSTSPPISVYFFTFYQPLPELPQPPEHG